MNTNYNFLVFYIFLLLTPGSVLVAQSSFICGHDIHMESMENQYPGYREVVAKTFADAKLHSQTRANSSNIYRIPVVIHVVWKEQEENLPDSVILSQLEVLNKDFRLLNEDRDQIREMYRDRQGDALIEFELVEIIRKQTDATFAPSLFELLPNSVKRSQDGGSDARDTEQFLNIWICKIQLIPFIQAQILGFAYPPAGIENWPEGASALLPELDGVVIDYRCVGANNSNPMEVPGLGNVFQNGRTVTHEVGHYLGLRHIWGDGGGIFGGSSCNEDDGIDDTPNQGRQSNYACDLDQNTCTEGMEANEPDMIENYMDYSRLDCQNTFTLGQVAIMRTVLEGPRSGLLSTVSSNRIEDQDKIWKVYPNPASSTVYLKGETLSGQIEMRDLQGRIVYMQDNVEIHEGLPLAIPIDYLKPGIYILHFTTVDFGMARKIYVVR